MRWITEERISATLIGAVAGAIRARARFTDDIDVLFIEEDARGDRLLDSAARYGFVPRSPQCPLLLRHEPTDVRLDVALGALPFHRKMIERSTLVDVGPLHLRLPTAEDLMITKAVAGRLRDLADVDELLAMNPVLDLDHVRHHVREFSEALEQPQLYEDFEKLVRRRNR